MHYSPNRLKRQLQLLKYLALVLLVLALSGCESDPGADNAGLKTGILTVVIVAAVLGVIYRSAQTRDEAKRQESYQRYNLEFLNFLREQNVSASNATTVRYDFGIAVADDLSRVLVKISQANPKILTPSDVLGSELSPHYNQVINSKTKAPLVAVRPTGNTSGNIAEKFSHADLIIRVKDIQMPLLKLTFGDLALAEKYDALLKMVTNKNSA